MVPSDFLSSGVNQGHCQLRFLVSLGDPPTRMPSSNPLLRVRHLSAVFALVAAPLAGVSWSFLVPLFTGMTDEIANVASQPGRWIGGTYFGIVMSFLMIPAAIAQGRLLRRVAPMSGDIASTICAAGACFHGALLVFQLAEAAIITGISDRSSATNAVNKLFEHPSFVMVLMPFFAFYIGLALLAAFMLWWGPVPRWIPVVILGAIVIELATPLVWKARLFFILLTLAFTGMSVVVWRLGAEEWVRRAALPLGDDAAERSF